MGSLVGKWGVILLFNSAVFFIFLTIVFILYYIFPRHRMIVLSLANTLFYVYAGIGYFFLFFAIVTSIFYLSKALNHKHGKLALIAALTIVLCNLIFFKYSIFLLENLEKLLRVHLSFPGTALDDRKIALPIGISFYSFQLIAYLIDVYRKKLLPSVSLFEFWVFISLFAHSAAGPILRGNDFLPQLRGIKKIKFRNSRIKLGLAFILLGLAKKVIIADQIAPHVNEYFDQVQRLGGIDSWIASYLFAFQIYFDFSAYSEMAVGIGYLLGLRLDINFRTPYLSSNSSEFWKRWHITLSQWIRDYIFIPLGGSRVKNWRIYFNITAAMVISGIWHGAAWTFIIWGFYHGVLSVAHNLYGKFSMRLGLNSLSSNRLYKIFAVVVFFHLTIIGWVFFRADSWGDAIFMVKQMLTLNGGFNLTSQQMILLLIVLALFLLHILEAVIVTNFRRLSLGWQLKVPVIVRGLIYSIIAIILATFLVKGESSSFIYFQF